MDAAYDGIFRNRETYNLLQEWIANHKRKAQEERNSTMLFAMGLVIEYFANRT